jgi:putative hydrolase of the HAD superfamily
VNSAPLALSLDLDDTLWPIAPAIERAEAALDDYLRQRCPRTAEKYPVPAMRALRERIAAAHPQHAHDFTLQRRLSLAHALRDAGDDEAHVDAAFDAFYAARNRIEFYPDALSALDRLAQRLPIAALTNGNADLGRIGISHRFAVFVSAHDEGHAKPDAPIFHSTCRQLGVAAGDVLHIGDDPWLDIAGAQGAGLRACWINRRNETWPTQLPPPDLAFSTLAALADWLDAHHPLTETA